MNTVYHSMCMKQHVAPAKYLLTPDNMTSINDVKVIDIGLSDHSLIMCKIVEMSHRAPIVTATFRCWKRLNIDSFKQKLLSSSVYRCPAATVNLFTDQLRNDICRILDELLPVHRITRISGKSTNHWLSREAVKAKERRRQLERRWKATGYEAVRVQYRKACREVDRLINESRKAFYMQHVTESSHDPRSLWRVVKGILHTNQTNTRYEPGMCDKFATYFRSKIDKVKASVTTCVQQVRNPLMQESKSPTASMDLLKPATEAEVLRVIMRLPNKTSPLDYVHTSVLKSCSSVFVQLVTRLINLWFSEECFPDQ